MVQSVVTLGEKQDRVLTIVKGKFGLKNKSDAMNHIISEYESELLEPELRPTYIEKMQKVQKGKTIKVADFNKHFGV